MKPPQLVVNKAVGLRKRSKISKCGPTFNPDNRVLGMHDFEGYIDLIF